MGAVTTVGDVVAVFMPGAIVITVIRRVEQINAHEIQVGVEILGDNGDSIGLNENIVSNSKNPENEDNETFDVWTNDDLDVFVDDTMNVDI